MKKGFLFPGGIKRIARQKLLDTLTDPQLHVPRLRKAMEPIGFARSAVILTALAGMESNYGLDEVGDFTGTMGQWVPGTTAESFGLWQINAPTWYSKGLPVDWELLGVQLQMVGANWRDATASILYGRKVFGVGEFDLSTEGTIAQIGWQYGGPRVRKWLRTKPARIAPLAFVTWLGTSEPFRDRQERFERQLNWAMGAVETGKKNLPTKGKGFFKTAFDFYEKKAEEELPGRGNLTGWIVVAVVGIVVLNRIIR